MNATIARDTDTPVDTAARALIAATIAQTATVDAYHAYTGDLRAVRAARADVAAAHRALIATPGAVFDPDLYLNATARARTSARVTRILIADHLAGNAPR